MSEETIHNIKRLEALLGGAAGDRDQLEEAKRICDDLLRKAPSNPNTACMRGMIAFHQGLTSEAEAWMEKAMGLAPQSAGISFNYAMIMLNQDRVFAALPLLMHVVALEPDHVSAHWQIGNALRKIGNAAGALAAFAKVRELNPREADALDAAGSEVAEALNTKGELLKEMGRLPEAAASFERALSFHPNHYGVLNNLGVINYLQNNLETAAALYETSLTLNPAYPEACNNLGNVRLLQGKREAALRHFRRAVELRPDYPDALNNLGNALKEGREHEEAIAAFQKALQLMPENPEIHMNLAAALLAEGRFAEGWQGYEWRWRSKHLNRSARDFGRPQWHGEAAQGRTLLIHAEQGLGDTLQFGRYAPLAKERGLRVILEVPPSLRRLMQSLEGVETVIATGEALPDLDLHCPMMSLPLAFQTTAQTIPGRLPYLSPAPADVVAWQRRMESLGAKAFNVGLVWAGSPRTHSPEHIAMERQRSMNPEVLAPLMDVPGVRFFSLQKEGTCAPEAFRLIDWMGECRDMADTAAFIMNLDLVISVDTAVVHLAGALGKPVWLLNRFNSCWRWFVDRDDSPWYPGVLRIFNQQALHAWDDVIPRVRAALAEL